ncbi:MAG TPA: DMT family transporter [Acidimicrobiia bacterium]|nr:DMT family transporter [Acidimicrobiia bacterium]
MGWALLAAVGFGITQIINRKANQRLDAFRTAFLMLVAVELVLVVRAAVTGELVQLGRAPLWAAAVFGAATLLHFGAGWTLLAASQQQVGVARTGALVSTAPLLGAVLAALFLDEPLTPAIVLGVLLVVIGVAVLSLSTATETESRRWTKPWFGLAVGLIWGSTPSLIRLGLSGFDAPVLGLTIGLGLSLAIQGLVLTAAGAWRRSPIARQTYLWMAAGGVTGAVGITAQWISFDETTIAIAISLQQLAVLVVLALVPLTFREPIEQITRPLVAGVGAVLAGTLLVVLTGA